ncbi:MAG TPA: GNAT family N-acetyltransferase, partial [Candidatus Methylomirabilis sp.]|nr:GNAT family N-acetyltransferase [Candidatus Methylomirabilis sp.]
GETALEFRDWCTPEFLSDLTADSNLGAFSRYSPQAAARQLAALLKVASLSYGRVLVAHTGRRLVGFLTFHPPEADSRWAGLPAGQILELGGIEVARNLRGRGIARRLMDLAFSTTDFDAVIVFAQALTWCWDLEGSGLGREAYREMMLRLFGAHGFASYVTDEPNIRYDRASILLARVGPKVPEGLRQRFQAMLIDRRA